MNTWYKGHKLFFYLFVVFSIMFPGDAPFSFDCFLKYLIFHYSDVDFSFLRSKLRRKDHLWNPFSESYEVLSIVVSPFVEFAFLQALQGLMIHMSHHLIQRYVSTLVSQQVWLLI